MHNDSATRSPSSIFTFSDQIISLMSISKKPLKGKPVTKVTFKVEKDLVPGAETVALVGDFNGWDQSAIP